MLSPAGPAINYAESSDGAKIAYSVTGAGMPLVFMPNPPASHIAFDWHIRERREFFEILSSDNTLVRYDCRGAGFSDAAVEDLSLEAHLADLLAIVDELGLESFALYAAFYAGPVAIRFAATHPGRVSHLVLFHSFARAEDYLRKPQLRVLTALIPQDWQLFTQAYEHTLIGWSEGVRAAERARLIQNTISPQRYQASFQEVARFDATENLSQLRMPTLVLRRDGFEPVDSEMTRSLASSIPNSHLRVLNGVSGSLFLGDAKNCAHVLNSFMHEGEVSGDADELAGGFGMTKRETEVLKLLSVGLRSKEIAQQVGLSVHTVERHIANIYRKIGANGRADAASFAVKHHLV